MFPYKSKETSMEIYVKQLSGDIIILSLSDNPTGDAIYREVWEYTPEAYTPTKLWLTLDGEWIKPSLDHAPVKDGDVLDVFVDTRVFELKWFNGGIAGALHKFRIRVESEECKQDVEVYFLVYEKGFYFEDEVDEDPERGYVPYRDCSPKLTLEELVDKFDVSLCDREWIWATLQTEFRERFAETDKQVYPIYLEEQECECEECQR